MRTQLLLCFLIVRGFYSATAQVGESALDDSASTFRISTNLVPVNVLAFRGVTSAPDATLRIGATNRHCKPFENAVSV
jgi:hypothetical protein